MTVKLRLARHGAKKSPYYRIVASENRAPRDGRFIDLIGIYDPTTSPETIRLNPGRIRYWLGVGAQPTLTVKSILSKHLTKAEEVAASNEVDAENSIWVQGPSNSPVVNGAVGAPNYEKKSVSIPDYVAPKVEEPAAEEAPAAEAAAEEAPAAEAAAEEAPAAEKVEAAAEEKVEAAAEETPAAEKAADDDAKAEAAE